MFIQHDVTKTANYKQLEKDLNLQKDEKILVFHNAVLETLYQIRTKFWITKPINYIRRDIKKSVVCNRHEGIPFQYPPPSDLLFYRLSDKFSFTYSAVDYAGPLCINNIYGKLQTFKCWSFYLLVLPHMSKKAHFKSPVIW